MITPEPSGNTTGRLDHPNLEEAEENDFKYNFMRMMEIFKQGIKNSLKEMQEKTKKMEELNKSLKENQLNKFFSKKKKKQSNR